MSAQVYVEDSVTTAAGFNIQLVLRSSPPASLADVGPAANDLGFGKHSALHISAAGQHCLSPRVLVWNKNEVLTF